jgi:hypothetical protein
MKKILDPSSQKDTDPVGTQVSCISNLSKTVHASIVPAKVRLSCRHFTKQVNAKAVVPSKFDPQESDESKKITYNRIRKTCRKDFGDGSHTGGCPPCERCSPPSRMPRIFLLSAVPLLLLLLLHSPRRGRKTKSRRELSPQTEPRTRRAGPPGNRFPRQACIQMRYVHFSQKYDFLMRLFGDILRTNFSYLKKLRN